MFKAEKNSIIPIPTDFTIKDTEDYLEEKFPEEYIKFIKQFNGCRPITKYFDYPNEIMKQEIDRFLYMIDEEKLIYGHSNFPFNGEETGIFNLLVVEATLGSRIIPKHYMDSYEIPIVPIARTIYHNYICLDYRHDRSNPTICFWDNDESKEELPVTITIANSFEEFIDGLYE